MNRKNLQRVFGTTEKKALTNLMEKISADSVRVHPKHPIRLVFFDSFDWRLYRRGWVLVQDGFVLHLCDRKSGLELARQDCQGAPPRFARDLPLGELHDYLAKALKIRALLHLVTVVGSAGCDQYTDPKTRRVWRLCYGDLRLAKHGRELSFLHTVSFEPINGRDSGGKRLTRLVKDVGFSALPATLLEPALQRAGLRPAAYSNRLRVFLERDQPAGEAVIQIATGLQSTLKANLKGIQKDIDSEFLHDFRVAGRRSRSLLVLCKKVVPKDLRRTFYNRFREMGAVTGPLRDLDVYLLHDTRYRSLVPEKLSTGLAEVSTRSEQLRSFHHEKVVRYLTSAEFQSILTRYSEVLASGPTTWDPFPKAANRPIGKLADKQVASSYIRMLKRGLALGAEPKDRQLHRLRIACKEHRYALEFFASLYPQQAVTALLSPLKQVQDLLGEHNDLVVHTAHLQDLLATEGAHALTPDGIIAAEELIVRLDEAKVKLRPRIARVFEGVAGAKTRKLVRKMTGG